MSKDDCRQLASVVFQKQLHQPCKQYLDANKHGRVNEHDIGHVTTNLILNYDRAIFELEHFFVIYGMDIYYTNILGNTIVNILYIDEHFYAVLKPASVNVNVEQIV